MAPNTEPLYSPIQMLLFLSSLLRAYKSIDRNCHKNWEARETKLASFLLQLKVLGSLMDVSNAPLLLAMAPIIPGNLLPANARLTILVAETPQ